MPLKMIIDCDPGLDDAIALIVACEFAQILGITAVAGNAPLAVTSGNALAIADWLGIDAQVYAGAERALAGEMPTAQHVHGSDGLGGVVLPEPGRLIADTHAVDTDKLWIMLSAAF